MMDVPDPQTISPIIRELYKNTWVKLVVWRDRRNLRISPKLFVRDVSVTAITKATLVARIKTAECGDHCKTTITKSDRLCYL